jgi:hypothetical protein
VKKRLLITFVALIVCGLAGGIIATIAAKLAVADYERSK